MYICCTDTHASTHTHILLAIHAPADTCIHACVEYDVRKHACSHSHHVMHARHATHAGHARTPRHRTCFAYTYVVSTRRHAYLVTYTDSAVPRLMCSLYIVLRKSPRGRRWPNGSTSTQQQTVHTLVRMRSVVVTG